MRKVDEILGFVKVNNTRPTIANIHLGMATASTADQCEPDFVPHEKYGVTEEFG